MREGRVRVWVGCVWRDTRSAARVPGVEAAGLLPHGHPPPNLPPSQRSFIAGTRERPLMEQRRSRRGG